MSKIPTDYKTLHNVLHKILEYIKDQSKYVDPTERQSYLDEIENLYLMIAINKLEKDGFVFRETETTGGYNKVIFRITYDGLLFLAKGGFNSQYNAVIRRNIWTAAKIIAATLNAIMILILSYLTLCISNKTAQLESQNQQLQDSIIKLNYRVPK